MLFAASFGEHVVGILVCGFLVVSFYVKIISAVDSDGEIKKTANQGLATWIGRWLK